MVLEFFDIMSESSRRRKRAFYDEDMDFREEQLQEDDADASISNVAAMIGVMKNKPPRKSRGEDKDRHIRKLDWEELYHQKTDEEIKDKMRITRTCVVVCI